MKVMKDGQIKLSSIDYRVGNFIYSNFTDAVGFCDINRTIQTRISKRLVVGLMLEKAIKDKDDRFLHNYAGFLYYLNGVTPDHDLLKECIESANRCIERHKDLYGKQVVSDTEENEIIDQMKGTQEFIDQVNEKVPGEE